MEEKCIYCGSIHLYMLSDGRVKCPLCKRRYGLKKLRRDLSLLSLFCDDTSAKEASERAGCSYPTAKKAFGRFREATLPLLEEEYEKHRGDILEYDEYLYLDHYKREKKRFIFDAHDFLTFDYGGRVYNILMPSLNRYKNSLLSDGMEDIYYEEFSRFLKIHRVTKLRTHKNTIIRFWSYLDDFMKKYRGVNDSNFIYYLKEAEFKFNHPDPKERFETLKTLLYPNE